jgi:hypothetical protein
VKLNENHLSLSFLIGFKNVSAEVVHSVLLSDFIDFSSSNHDAWRKVALAPVSNISLIAPVN